MDKIEIYSPKIPGRHFTNAIITWKIQNSSFALSPNLTRSIYCPPLTLRGPIPTLWRLWLNLSRERDTLTLELQMMPTEHEVQKVKVKWVSYILNFHGDYSFEQERSFSFVPWTKETLKVYNLKTIMESLSVKSDDNVEMKCHMLVDFGFRPDFTEPDVGLAALKRDFERLPRSFLHHDIVTTVSDTKFSLHRAMLCHRSGKLAELIKNPDMNMEVIFPFSDAKAAEAVFKYLYTGDLRFIVENPSITICEYIERLAVPEMKNIYPKEIITVTVEMEVHEESFLWNISDFPRLKQPLKSPMFYKEKIASAWELCMYPTVLETDPKRRVEHIRIEATVLHCEQPMEVCLEFSILTEGKCMSFRRVQGGVLTGSKLEVSFFSSVNEVVEHIDESSLTLLFKLRIAGKSFANSIRILNFEALPVTIDQSYSHLTSCMDTLKKSLAYSDATFKVGEIPFKVHKFLIAARSPTFKEIFVKQASADTIELPSDQYIYMEKFIGQLYSGTLQDTSIDYLLDLWYMGELYKVESLQYLCENQLKRNITNDNVLPVLLFARKHGCLQLNVIANCHIIKNYVDVKKHETWKTFSEYLPELCSYMEHLYEEWNY